MLLQGPSAVTFVPTATQVLIQSVSFDLVGHTFVVVYQPPSGGPLVSKQIGGTIPGALQTALENHAKTVIETNEGWTAGSSTVTQA